MGEWLAGVKRYVLVGVGGFAVCIEVERAVWIMDYGYIKHGNPSIFLNFFGPTDVWVYGVEVVVKWLNVVVVYGNKGVVGFP